MTEEEKKMTTELHIVSRDVVEELKPWKADEFVTKYEVAHHHATKEGLFATDDTGLSFTVFEEKEALANYLLT